MDLKTQLFLLIIFLTIKIQSQEIEILHYTSSDQTYHTTCTNGDENLFIYLHFYGPGIIDYEKPPYFFTTGWYELGTTGEKKTALLSIIDSSFLEFPFSIILFHFLTTNKIPQLKFMSCLISCPDYFLLLQSHYFLYASNR